MGIQDALPMVFGFPYLALDVYFILFLLNVNDLMFVVNYEVP